MAECAFSKNGNYYCAISSDGRIRIWDTETNVLKQEYTPDLHLTSPASCLQWLTVTTTGQKQKGKRNSINEHETEVIALGTSSGKILLYSVAQAKVESVLVDEKNSKVHNNSITCLDWHSEHGLYSCSKGNYVSEWDIESSSVKNKYNISLDSKKQYVSAIKIVPHKQKTSATFLVTASWQVCVWRLHNSEATVIKQLSHNASPRAILTVATLKNMCWLIEGSQNERLLSFWDITISKDNIPLQNGDASTPKRQRKKSTSLPAVVSAPTYNFVLEDAPKAIDVDVRGEEEGVQLSLAAVTRSGVVHYYRHMLNGASVKPIKPSVTIQVTSAQAQPLPAQCCRLVHDDLQIQYSMHPGIVFERVTPDLKTKTQVLIRGDTKAKRSKLTKSERNDGSKPSVDDAGEVTYVEPMGGVSRKRPIPGATVEVPMEARLANLALSTNDAGSTPVSQNLTKLLMQGLHSNDKSMILTVLQRNDARVAYRTVCKLPAECVPKLLDVLADMAARKTSQCACVATWVSAVLRCHCALLLATAATSNGDKLMTLLAVFTHRRAHLVQLLNLRGRLQLTASLREQRLNVDDHQPLIHYEDTSESDSEDMEVEESNSELSFSESEHSDTNTHQEGD